MDFEMWQIMFLMSVFANGMRVSRLQDQPSPWVIEGLKILESGGELKVEKMAEINRSGGTDHPDPWFG